MGLFQDSTVARNNMRREFNAATDEIMIGIVGRLTEIKNIPLFLKVAEMYTKDDRTEWPNLRFVIIGDGHLRESLEKEASELGVLENVNFLGNRSDTESVYAGLDIVALTSFNEGTPLSLIEAMAAGKAVISMAVGGVVDLLGKIEDVRDGFNICERGIAVETNSAEEFLKGLIFLAENENLRESLTARGREFVEAEYSKDRLIEDIRSLYRRLI